jgi:hypothetical protein
VFHLEMSFESAIENTVSDDSAYIHSLASTAPDFQNPISDASVDSINTYDTLYSSLSYNLKEADLTTEEKDFLISRTNDPTMPQEKKEIIYSLCLIDYSKFSPNTKVVFPYKCKQVRDDVLEIKLDSLPIRLKQILYKFVNF